MLNLVWRPFHHRDETGVACKCLPGSAEYKWLSTFHVDLHEIKASVEIGHQVIHAKPRRSELNNRRFAHCKGERHRYRCDACISGTTNATIHCHGLVGLANCSVADARNGSKIIYSYIIVGQSIDFLICFNPNNLPVWTEPGHQTCEITKVRAYIQAVTIISKLINEKLCDISFVASSRYKPGGEELVICLNDEGDVGVPHNHSDENSVITHISRPGSMAEMF